MSFGGGGGTTGVTAHTHSNASGDGGSLSISDTLIANRPIYGAILAGA